MEAKLAEAKKVKSQAEKDLLNIPGVNAVDIGYKYVNGKRTDEISIRVHVTKKRTNVNSEEMIPPVIDGIKTDVIEGHYELQIATAKVEDTVSAEDADTTKFRPLCGGISMGPDRSVGGLIFAGTLGCFVTDNGTGNVLMLSNFHVMCINNGSNPGDVMDQPSLIDTGTHADGVGTLNRDVLSGHVDGAVANINNGIGYLPSIAQIGTISGTSEAVLGGAVRKRGRTTELTFGTVDGLSGSVNIDYGTGIGVRTLTDQIFIRPDLTQNPAFSDHGDSGSTIVDGINCVVGLLFAGDGTNTFANPISFVETELNVKVFSPYQLRILEVATTFASETDGDWLMADYDQDGIPDLVFIKTTNTPGNMVEVHIASGASNYQTRVLDVASTFASETDGTWLMADYDRDGTPDLVFIKTTNTPGNMVEVHIASGASNYQTRILDVATTFGAETDGTWLMADIDRDGIPDLVFIKTANTPNNLVEVHVASGASNYQTRILEVQTTFACETDGTWTMADVDQDGTPDLVFIKTANTPNNKVEVHVASGSSNYQTRILEVQTTFEAENNGAWLMADYDRDGVPDLVYIKTTNTPNNLVEVHMAKGLPVAG